MSASRAATTAGRRPGGVDGDAPGDVGRRGCDFVDEADDATAVGGVDFGCRVVGDDAGEGGQAAGVAPEVVVGTDDGGVAVCAAEAEEFAPQGYPGKGIGIDAIGDGLGRRGGDADELTGGGEGIDSAVDGGDGCL